MGAPKHALVLGDGRTMFEWVAAALGCVCDRIVVAGAVGELDIDATVVLDRRPGLGPLAGIEAALESGGDEQYLVCPCDMPLITGALLVALAGSSPAVMSVLRVEAETDPRPLPARISARALPQVQALLDAGVRAVHRLVAAVPAEVIDIPASAAAALANVNTREEYEEVLGVSPGRGPR
jgi:molybdopterin-guanine dinucleotide biosynthesis protein A